MLNLVFGAGAAPCRAVPVTNLRTYRAAPFAPANNSSSSSSSRNYDSRVIDTHVHITPNHCYIIKPTVHVLVHSYCLHIPIGFSNLAIKAILTPYCHIPQRYPPWTCFKVISLFSQKFNKHCCLLFNMLHFNGTNSCWDNRL